MSAGSSTAARSTRTPPRQVGEGAPALGEPLAAELEAGPWDFPWRLAPGLVARAGDPGARHAIWSLERMVEEPVRDALAMPGSSATALDLGCGEGVMAHALLRWGSARVVGVETRARHLRRAELLREHLAPTTRRLELRGVDDLRSLDPSVLGPFDVVSLVGIFDRVEEAGALTRLARACTRRLCVIEGPGADVPAIAQAARDAGFGSVLRASPVLDAEPRYATGERSVLLARPGETR